MITGFLHRARWLALGLPLLVMASASADSKAPKIKVGDVPPSYLGIDGDGEPVNLSNHKGKVVVVTFWASWCGPCRKELPIMENVQRQAGADRLRVIAVNIDNERSDRRAMRRELKGWQLLMTTDEDKKARSAYGVDGIPHMVMVDHLGEVAFRHIGYSEELLPKIVEELNVLLEDQEAATPSTAAVDTQAFSGGP